MSTRIETDGQNFNPNETKQVHSFVQAWDAARSILSGQIGLLEANYATILQVQHAIFGDQIPDLDQGGTGTDALEVWEKMDRTEKIGRDERDLQVVTPCFRSDYLQALHEASKMASTLLTSQEQEPAETEVAA